jgi:hypothetical protein
MDNVVQGMRWDPRIAFHAYDDGVLWASSGNKVLRSTDLGVSFQTYATPQDNLLSGITRLTDRLLRRGVHDVLPLDSRSVLVMTHGKTHLYIDGELENVTQHPSIRRATRTCLSALTDRTTILLGEYLDRSERIPVSIFVSRDQGRSWEPLWASTAPHPKHVHFVIPNTHSPESAYFGTGDYDHEPGIFTIDTRSGEVECLGSGSQEWRAVSLIQRGTALIWGTDCEYGENHIVRYDTNVKTLEKLATLPGPAYYSATDLAGNMYIATTIETRNAHRACIYASSDGVEWHSIAEFKKDRYHLRYFGYGTIEFIRGQEQLQELFINLRGLNAQANS